MIEAHDGGVTTTDPTVPALLLLREGGNGGRLRARPARWWERLGARLLARSLDRQLVEGDPPEGRPLLATRAQALVAPAQRQSMAANWEHLLELTGEPSVRRIPLCRDRIAAAESSVREMLVALVAPLPVPVRGVAGASLLLSDGSGPLYNRRSPTDLVEAVTEVTEQLDPSLSLVLSR
jgi:hypothetical protein